VGKQKGRRAGFSWPGNRLTLALAMSVSAVVVRVIETCAWLSPTLMFGPLSATARIGLEED
jgi:hypothetical protein